MPQRQTSSFLRNRFAEVGIRPDTRKGQNFLIDLNLHDVLVDAAELDPQHDVVLEVGTGTGALTGLMASRARHVITVEIDPQLHALARDELVDLSNITFLSQDVLKNKGTIAPAVIERIRGTMQEVAGASLKLVANLPYGIATPLISNLLTVDPLVTEMVVTIQKELADRIVAAPRCKDYSALSVWVQSLADAEIIRVLPPSVFWPRPKVDSAIIKITPSASKREALDDWPGFNRFVRALFLHRRKFLRSCLKSTFKHELTKPQLDELMGQLGFGPTTRAEELEIPQLHRLYSAAIKMIKDA